jgi:hypothetical protein
MGTVSFSLRDPAPDVWRSEEIGVRRRELLALPMSAAPDRRDCIHLRCGVNSCFENGLHRSATVRSSVKNQVDDLRLGRVQGRRDDVFLGSRESVHFSMTCSGAAHH